MRDVPRCQHIKVNGVQCGSPALRRKRHCFFHKRLRDRQARMLRGRASHRPFALPMVEDANSLHLALMDVLQKLAAGRLEPKTAGLMLWGLQTVSGNLKRTCFEPEHVRDVVIDRHTVDQTCIGGPQWLEREFGEEEPSPETTEPSRIQPQREDDAESPATPVRIFAQAAPENAPVKRSVASARPSRKRPTAKTTATAHAHATHSAKARVQARRPPAKIDFRHARGAPPNGKAPHPTARAISA